MWNDAAGGFIPDLYEPEYNNTLIFLQKYGLQTAAGRLNRCPQQQDRYRRWLNWSPLWCSFLLKTVHECGGLWCWWWVAFFFLRVERCQVIIYITGTICIHEIVYYKKCIIFMNTPSFTFRLLWKKIQNTPE